MLFDDRKLEPSQLAEMVSCPIETIEPFSLLLAPAYIYMKLNDRVVPVKGPLDFFTPEELEKVRRYETVYFPQFVKSSVQFQTAARFARKILGLHADQLPRATYELMREVTLSVSELWFSDLKVEPFFAAVFAQELCDPLTPQRIQVGREEAIARHDYGLLLSGMFVFVAVQLGWLDLAALTQCRNEIYDRTVRGEDWCDPKSEMDSILVEIHRLLASKNQVSYLDLILLDSEWARLLAAKIKGWTPRLVSKNVKSPSIHGPEGIVA